MSVNQSSITRNSRREASTDPGRSHPGGRRRALALTACGSDDAADEPGVIAVNAIDFAYEDLPDSVPAGTRLTLANSAPSELHEIVAFRLPDDETRPVSELMTLPPEEMGSLFAGEPAMVLLTPPGGDASDQIAAVGDGTLSEPGRYLLLCAIPTGVSPDVYLAAAAESGGGPPRSRVAGRPTSSTACGPS
jgi:hypothetical protein